MSSELVIQDSVSVECVDQIALITIHNPPVNAISAKVREGLEAAIAQIQHDDQIKVAALICEGRTFVAGADIREFGKPRVAPYLADLTNKIAQSAKPYVSVMHGVALGGGLELALATHYRVGTPDLKLGLPENLLGVLPGAGGTQRLPRLVGIKRSLEMILTGERVPADRAQQDGILDAVEAGAPRDLAMRFARKILSGEITPHMDGDVQVEPDEQALTGTLERLSKTSSHLFSPFQCVEVISHSVRPLQEGLAKERELFLRCLASPQRAGLIHAFFAERAPSNIPEKGQAQDVSSIGIIGAGTMGSGIATSLLLGGFKVQLIELNPEALTRGLEAIRSNLDGAIKRGKLTETGMSETLQRLNSSSELQALAKVDLVIEAVFEDMAVKKQIFADLDKICQPDCILATNTSYLDINEIAATTNRPDKVLGLHFFSPAHIMRLLEIVVADQTSAQTVMTGMALGKKLRKIAVRSGVCEGFIGNRINSFTRKAADYLMMDGASPYQIDKAMEAFGFAMGVFRVGDLAGLDIAWATRKRLAATRSSEERYIPIADHICENGWFGRKMGLGYYDYSQRPAAPRQQILAIIDQARNAANIRPKDFTDQEIMERYMAAMISEAVRVLEDGIALRPIDIDAVFLFGFGFPRHMGGPLHYADQVGAASLVRQIEGYAQEDAHYWSVPDLLRDMAEQGRKFSDMNDE